MTRFHKPVFIPRGGMMQLRRIWTSWTRIRFGWWELPEGAMPVSIEKTVSKEMLDDLSLGGSGNTCPPDRLLIGTWWEEALYFDQRPVSLPERKSYPSFFYVDRLFLLEMELKWRPFTSTSSLSFSLSLLSFEPSALVPSVAGSQPFTFQS